MMKDGTMDVEMSQAVAGIKGTVLITEETGSKSTLKVIEGHVNYTSKVTGKSEMVGPGEMITATKKGLGKKKEFNIDTEKATWANNEAMIKDTSQKANYNSNNTSENTTGILIPLVAIILFVFIIGGYYVIHNKRKSKK